MVALRRNGLPARALRWPLIAATAVALAVGVLAASALGRAAVLSPHLAAWDLALMWSAVGLLLAGLSSGVSLRRSLA